MSDLITIYTAGKMSGTEYSDQMLWRRNAETILLEHCKKAKFIHPPLYYNYEHQSHKTEREIKEFELSKLANSDVLLINLEGINSSVGVHFEIAHACAVNSFSNHHIFIIGFGGDYDNVHPWIKDSLFRYEYDLCKAIEYISDYLIN